MGPWCFHWGAWHRSQPSPSLLAGWCPPLDGDALLVNQSTASSAQHDMEGTTFATTSSPNAESRTTPPRAALTPPVPTSTSMPTPLPSSSPTPTPVTTPTPPTPPAPTRQQLHV